MFGGREAEVERGDEPVQVFREERLRIEPEPGEDLGTIEPIRAGREPFEPVVSADEPVNLIGIEGDHEIFEDAGPLVIPEFRAEVDPPARPGDLDDQLRATGKILPFASGPDRRARVG